MEKKSDFETISEVNRDKIAEFSQFSWTNFKIFDLFHRLNHTECCLHLVSKIGTILRIFYGVWKRQPLVKISTNPNCSNTLADPTKIYNSSKYGFWTREWVLHWYTNRFSGNHLRYTVYSRLILFIHQHIIGKRQL